jgi:hypothetical protein
MHIQTSKVNPTLIYLPLTPHHPPPLHSLSCKVPRPFGRSLQHRPLILVRTAYEFHVLSTAYSYKVFSYSLTVPSRRRGPTLFTAPSRRRGLALPQPRPRSSVFFAFMAGAKPEVRPCSPTTATDLRARGHLPDTPVSRFQIFLLACMRACQPICNFSLLPDVPLKESFVKLLLQTRRTVPGATPSPRYSHRLIVPTPKRRVRKIGNWYRDVVRQ